MYVSVLLLERSTQIQDVSLQVSAKSSACAAKFTRFKRLEFIVLSLGFCDL
jgi:hypothetical protein